MDIRRTRVARPVLVLGGAAAIIAGALTLARTPAQPGHADTCSLAHAPKLVRPTPKHPHPHVTICLGN